MDTLAMVAQFVPHPSYPLSMVVLLKEAVQSVLHNITTVAFLLPQDTAELDMDILATLADTAVDTVGTVDMVTVVDTVDALLATTITWVIAIITNG